MAVVRLGADILTLLQATNEEPSMAERCFFNGGLQQGQEVYTMLHHFQQVATVLMHHMTLSNCRSIV